MIGKFFKTSIINAKIHLLVGKKGIQTRLNKIIPPTTISQKRLGEIEIGVNSLHRNKILGIVRDHIPPHK